MVANAMTAMNCCHPVVKQNDARQRYNGTVTTFWLEFIFDSHLKSWQKIQVDWYFLLPSIEIEYFHYDKSI